MTIAGRYLRLVKPGSVEADPVRILPDLADFEFVYSQHADRVVDVPPSPHIRRIHGAIERSRFREVVGRFVLAHVNATLAGREGKSLESLAAMDSSDLVDVCASLREMLPPPSFHPNILVIQRIEVLPAHRGGGLGLALVRQLIRRHSVGCGMAAIKVRPLQYFNHPLLREKDDYERRMEYDTFDWGVETGIRKLKNYFGELGFREIGSDNVMVISLVE